MRAASAGVGLVAAAGWSCWWGFSAARRAGARLRESARAKEAEARREVSFIGMVRGH